jgi:hypothetical protein
MRIAYDRDGNATLTAEEGATLQIAKADSDAMEAAIAAFAQAHPEAMSGRVLVPKHVIVDRLQAAGKLGAARAALDAADLYTRERWNTRDAIYADDESALALLAAIGADPADILAPA